VRHDLHEIRSFCVLPFQVELLHNNIALKRLEDYGDT